MESPTEAELLERRRELWKLLSSLKTTVEGLLSTNNPNVWSRYGGLQRLHKDMSSILSHGLKNEQVYNKQKDYWRFVWCVRYISPHLASHVEQFSQLEPVLSSGVQAQGESYKAERWLLHSLQGHLLSAQLKPLLKHHNNTRKYYNDEAFVLSEPHVSAMFQCLEAVEQNDPRLLALIDTVRLSHLKEPSSLGLLKSQSLCLLPGAMGAWRTPEAQNGLSRRMTTSQCSLREASVVTPLGLAESISGAASRHTEVSDGAVGAPWDCAGGGVSGEQQHHPSCSVPHISLTEPRPGGVGTGVGVSSSEALELDDGPEYLAIGNLGQRSRRRDSHSSTRSSEQGEGEGEGSRGGGEPVGGGQSLATATVPRRCSFSEGQRGPGLAHGRGHTRSLSDTGLTQKRRLGE
ncbi:hypothetical protein AALO_G00132930 [Alosa alosa]|uniref:RUN domain-containing protein n=1 Tax=Alosa alosa TaxID=278164 RepID=A0AAV6GRD6_9TELE|nr:hypothetical protein AALO_G00132930 [Alosa alosa]